MAGISDQIIFELLRSGGQIPGNLSQEDIKNLMTKSNLRNQYTPGMPLTEEGMPNPLNLNVPNPKAPQQGPVRDVAPWSDQGLMKDVSFQDLQSQSSPQFTGFARGEKFRQTGETTFAPNQDVYNPGYKKAQYPQQQQSNPYEDSKIQIRKDLEMKRGLENKAVDVNWHFDYQRNLNTWKQVDSSISGKIAEAKQRMFGSTLGDTPEARQNKIAEERNKLYIKQLEQEQKEQYALYQRVQFEDERKKEIKKAELLASYQQKYAQMDVMTREIDKSDNDAPEWKAQALMQNMSRVGYTYPANVESFREQERNERIRQNVMKQRWDYYDSLTKQNIPDERARSIAGLPVGRKQDEFGAMLKEVMGNGSSENIGNVGGIQTAPTYSIKTPPPPPINIAPGVVKTPEGTFIDTPPTGAIAKFFYESAEEKEKRKEKAQKIRDVIFPKKGTGFSMNENISGIKVQSHKKDYQAMVDKAAIAFPEFPGLWSKLTSSEKIKVFEAIQKQRVSLEDIMTAIKKDIGDNI